MWNVFIVIGCIQILELVRGVRFLSEIFYAAIDENEAKFVLEFACGGSLAQYIKTNGKLTLYSARIASAEILLGISFLHKHNIIHRDIKPDNVLVGSDGHMILSDFGLSCKLESFKKLYDICGTRDFMAPGK